MTLGLDTMTGDRTSKSVNKKARRSSLPCGSCGRLGSASYSATMLFKVYESHNFYRPKPPVICFYNSLDVLGNKAGILPPVLGAGPSLASPPLSQALQGMVSVFHFLPESYSTNTSLRAYCVWGPGAPFHFRP